MNPLIIASLGAPSTEERRVQKFAEWMGVQTRSIAVNAKADPVKQLLDGGAYRSSLAVTADTLSSMYKSASQPTHLRAFFEKDCSTLFVFRCGDTSRHGALLSWLTEGAIRGVDCVAEDADQNMSFQMPRAGQMFSRQLGGMSFSISRRVSQAFFELSAQGGETTPIMLVDHRPSFLSLKIGACNLFLFAESETPDIEEPLTRSKGIEEHYDQIIPFLIFLRFSFGETCWHAPESTARFIIDDPLLMDRYGLLHYSTLLSSMTRIGYGTSIAFIPWNYRRTSRQWAASLLEKKANLSVCVHGCDHTNKEFDALDPAILELKARVALSRMEKHEERTKLPFERIMVFPQGRFSTYAISALRSTNYLAAVNTSCFPTDYVPGSLTIADFLRPAVTRFYGFPIFQRHYPQNPIDFAFDMFLGKPALLVEHHQYLGDGCEELEKFVQELQKIEPELSWPPLSSQLTESCVTRSTGTDSFDVKIFTRRFRLKNARANKCAYQLEKDEPDASVIQSVQVDGEPVPFTSGEGIIRFEAAVEAGQARQIEIVDHARPNIPVKRSGVTYNFGVLFRRELSEFRDNTLSRHPAMLKVTREVARRMKMTGDRKKEVES